MGNERLSICLGILLLPLGSHAQSVPATQHSVSEVPRVLQWGLDLLRRDSYDEAEKDILAGSRIPPNGSLASEFRACREQDGQFQDFKVVSTQEITPRLHIFYLALEYEKAPHFIKFTLYRTPDGWVVLHSLWITSEDIFETMPGNRPAVEP